MNQFEELGIAEPILRALEAEGYDTPTPIQAQAIPALLDGNDVLGIAQTGTGKTAAFVLPILDKILKMGSKPTPNYCKALILAPTRELANQIILNIRTYSQFIGVRVTLIVGGAKPGPQIKALARGTDIIVATPGRLEDHMKAGKIRLSRTNTIVLDEADQMLDLGFFPAIRRIMGKLPEERQSLMFSATMPKPIRALAQEFQHNPVEVKVTPESTPVERIDQRIYAVDGKAKQSLLAKLLREPDVTRAMVFTRTKRGADRVAKRLTHDGFTCVAIHGDKSQSQRTRALKSFEAGEAPIMIATDVAARGIHINDVSHVFNYDLPEVAEVYVHRIGRTARAGKSGVAIGFCSQAERNLLKAIEKLTGLTLLSREDAAKFNDMPALPESKPKSRGRGRPRSGEQGRPKNSNANRPRRNRAKKPGSASHSSAPGKGGKSRNSRPRPASA